MLIAAIAITVYSMAVLLPSLLIPKLWRWQNRLVDWADEWAFEPLYRHTHPSSG